MNLKSCYYNCSPEYISQISDSLHSQVLDLISRLPKRKTQAEINSDLWWLFTSMGWNYDSIPSSVGELVPSELGIQADREQTKNRNNRDLCLTTTILNTQWRSVFSNSYEGKLVQVEAQFGKVEAMFKDFCGFRIAYAEKRLALGIEIGLVDPPTYFAYGNNAIGRVANFDIAKNTLKTIGLNAPIWLVGIE